MTVLSRVIEPAEEPKPSLRYVLLRLCARCLTLQGHNIFPLFLQPFHCVAANYGPVESLLA